jgi:hypothetical protein
LTIEAGDCGEVGAPFVELELLFELRLLALAAAALLSTLFTAATAAPKISLAVGVELEGVLEVDDDNCCGCCCCCIMLPKYALLLLLIFLQLFVNNFNGEAFFFLFIKTI